MASTPFVRSPFTWQSYLMLTWFAYHQSSLGPLNPFLSDELHLGYTVAAFHTSAFAIGALLVGISGDTLVSRFGRRAVAWIGSLSMAIGALMLAIGQHPVVTIAATFMMGFGGILMIISLQAALIDHHNEHRTTALTEMMAFSGLAGVLTPLMIGGFERAGISWRWVPALGLVIGLALAIRFFRRPVPPARVSREVASRRSLPTIFWVFWLVMFLGIAIGWCMGFWSAEFLDQEVGLQTELASALMSVFFGASVAGRLISSRLSQRVDTDRLLLGWVLLMLVGFPLFWLSPVALLNVAGLLLMGMGAGNTVPLVVSLATQAIPDQIDAVNARGALAGGLAILILPQAVGSVADVAGIKTAFSLVFVLLLAMLAVILAAHRLLHEQRPAATGLEPHKPVL